MKYSYEFLIENQKEILRKLNAKSIDYASSSLEYFVTEHLSNKPFQHKFEVFDYNFQKVASFDSHFTAEGFAILSKYGKNFSNLYLGAKK